VGYIVGDNPVGKIVGDGYEGEDVGPTTVVGFDVGIFNGDNDGACSVGKIVGDPSTGY
jgi:hypothetical protein